MRISKKFKKICWFFLIVFVLLAALYWHFRNLREHRYWVVEQKLSNGDKIIVTIDHNFKKIYRFPSEGHLTFWSIGGDDGRYDMYFSYKGRSYFFKEKGQPILINTWNSDFYIVIKRDDSPRQKYEPKLYFYKYVDKWTKIKAEEFPKQISIANIYFTLGYPYPDEPDDINGKDNRRFRMSPTVRLWLMLEKGLEYYKTDQSHINKAKNYQLDPNFIMEYREKYIDPFWSGKNFKEYLPVVALSLAKKLDGGIKGKKGTKRKVNSVL